jgi:hypothetical protein
MLTSHQQWRDFYPFFESFGPQVLNVNRTSDFRWEREWRHPGDLFFTFNEIAFGICPDNKIQKFEALTGGQVIFIDPDWDIPTLTTYFTSKGAAGRQLLNAI